MTTRVWQGYVLVPALACLAELGLTERWRRGEAIAVAAFCAERGIRPEVVVPLADYLVTQGYLSKDGGVYRHVQNLPELEDAVTKWPLAALFSSYAPVLSGLAQSARGGPVARAALTGPFVAALQASTHRRVIEYLCEHPVDTVIDVDGGDGTFRAVAAPELRGMRMIGVADLGAAADLLESLNASSVAVTLFFSLHRTAYRAPNEAIRSLRRFTTLAGARLIVSEIMRPSADDLARFHGHTGVSELVTLQDVAGDGFLAQDTWMALLRKAAWEVDEVLTSAPRVQRALPTIGTLVASPRPREKSRP